MMIGLTVYVVVFICAINLTQLAYVYTWFNLIELIVYVVACISAINLTQLTYVYTW